jgi:ferrous iron transport protein A
MAIAEAFIPMRGSLSKPDESASILSLDKLARGVEARVVSINGANAVARRLMEMGVVPGVPVRMIKAAPLGDPIEIRVRGYNLALRRAEAQSISITTQRA